MPSTRSCRECSSILAVAQMGAAVVGFVRPGRLAAALLAAVNAVALAGWIATRVTGISWIDGLEVARTSATGRHHRRRVRRGRAGCCARRRGCATSRRVEPSGHGRCCRGRRARRSGPVQRHQPRPRVPRRHRGGGRRRTRPRAQRRRARRSRRRRRCSRRCRGRAQPRAVTAMTTTMRSPPPMSRQSQTPRAPTVKAMWPRPWDPAAPIDFSGVPGVTPEQQARAEQLVRDTLRDLPAFADVGHDRCARISVDRRRRLRLRALPRLQAARPTTRRSIPPRPNRSCTASTARSARSYRRCSSSPAHRSTTLSWSTSAGR